MAITFVLRRQNLNNIFYRSIYGNFGIALSSRTSVQLSKLSISVIQISIWFKMLWNIRHRSHLFYSYRQSIHQLGLDHKHMSILTRYPIFQVTSGTNRLGCLVFQIIAPGHTSRTRLQLRSQQEEIQFRRSLPSKKP